MPTVDLSNENEQAAFLAAAAGTFKAANVGPERGQQLLARHLQKVALSEYVSSPQFPKRVDCLASKIAGAIKIARVKPAATPAPATT